MTAASPVLPAYLEAGQKRLKLATIRRMAPEVLQTAKTQRWKPEEVLRTFVEAEIAARDEANRRGRHRAAFFRVVKTFDAGVPETRSVDSRQLELSEASVVGSFVLRGWDVAEGLEQAAGVEPVHPLQDGELDIVDAPLGAASADDLGLEQPDERLGKSVVVGVTD